MLYLLSKDRIIAPPDFNRWRVPPASVAIHLCIGSVYAWSLFNPPLMKLHGVVSSAADDWTLSQVTWVFTVAIVCLGLSAAVAGKWLEQVGPRLVGCVAACCWGGGFLIGGIGVLTHQLWLLYLGYGVIGGCGLGLGYVSPVSTLIKWFPDRRGMATGLAIMGFGGGAIIGAPLKETLMKSFYVPPKYLGTVEEIGLTTTMGRRFANLDGQSQEVVVVGKNETSQMLVKGPEGVYVVGTGRTGVAETFFVLGLSYFLVMILAAFSYRIPAAGWIPAGWTPARATAPHRMITTHHVTADEAIKTPQFYLLWIVLCFNVTAGIGVLGVAKTMMGEIFGTTLPLIVTSSFAATFVLMMSVFNMLGRFAWSTISDDIGRPRVYAIFFSLGAVLYASIPWIASAQSKSPSVTWLIAFYAVTMLIFTMYGGGFAAIPAYLSDLFGTRFVGAIHGRLLTAWSTAGVLGPVAITFLRDRSLRAELKALAAKVDASAFETTFGAPLNQLATLIDTKTVTLPKLMALAPLGTIDPSSTLYSSTMLAMAALLVIAFVANALVRPVDPKYYCQETT
ncbi:MAG: OFA family MFS transporter [Planctomycetales bacterium]|jgi:MFS family permease|nr:OFA family MFS transporter [Planctomycetales bacterium]